MAAGRRFSFPFYPPLICFIRGSHFSDKRNALKDKVDEVNGKISELLVKVSASETSVDSCASRVEEANSTAEATKELMTKIDNSLNRAKSKLEEVCVIVCIIGWT